MDKTLKAGIVVEAVVLVAALAFSVAYFALDLNKSSYRIDILLIIAWVLVAAILLFVLYWRSLVRAETVRRVFVGPTGLYNYEAGFLPADETMPSGKASELVDALPRVLSKLSYSYDISESPEDFEPYLLVSSASFASHQVDGAPIVDRWKGNVQRIETGANGNHTYVDMGSFDGKEQLTELLEEVTSLA